MQKIQIKTFLIRTCCNAYLSINAQHIYGFNVLSISANSFVETTRRDFTPSKFSEAIEKYVV